MNIAYRDTCAVIWENDGNWRYDDTNATTLPKATTDLVDGQQDYAIPSTAQRINRVEVLDSAGNAIKVRPLDMNEVGVGLPEFLGGNNGLPLYYELVGRSILLYPTPGSGEVTTTNGLTLYVDRDITELAVSATTTEPGFAPSFHRILSYACAIDFSQEDSQRNFLIAQKDRLEQMMRRFYSKRAPEMKTKVKPHSRKRWRNYT